MDTSRKVTGADTKLTWIDEGFIAEKAAEVNLAPWHAQKGPEAGASMTGIKDSVAQGLKARPLEQTVRDTLAWHATRPAERQAALRSGFTAEQEAAILADWHARKG